MKWFELWFGGEQNRRDDYLLLSIHDFGSASKAELCMGQRVEYWPSGAWYASESTDDDGEPDDILAEHLGIPVFSERLRRALGKIGSNDIQYLPVAIRNSKGKEYRGFQIANVVTRLSGALDLAASNLATRVQANDDDVDFEVLGIYTTVLCKEALRDHDVIRLDEFWPAIYVSDAFRTAFQISSCTGATFKEVHVS